MKFIIFLLTTFFIAPLPAQEVSEPAQGPAPLAVPEEKFAAIVQFAEGKQEYDYKDLIFFKKTIVVPKDSYLKVITQKRCVAVFYENSKIQTPEDKVSAWKIVSGSARWICPEDKIEKVIYKKSEIHVQNGEFLLNNGQLTILRDNVKFENANLELKTIYILKDGKWIAKDDQPEPYDLWKKYKKFPAPLESSFHKLDAPEDPYVTRVFLNVAPIGVTGFYHHDLENKVSDLGMEGHFFRLGTNFPWRNRSVFAFLEYAETDGDEGNSMGPPPIGTKSVQTETATIALGLRHSHPKSSSFYYYLGFSRVNMRFHTHPDAISYYDGEIVYPFSASAGTGYQKIFWAKNWISLMVGIDLKLTQSLTKGKIHNYNHPPSDTADIRGMHTSYGGFVYLGPVFNF